MWKCSIKLFWLHNGKEKKEPNTFCWKVSQFKEIQVFKHNPVQNTQKYGGDYMFREWVFQ